MTQRHDESPSDTPPLDAVTQDGVDPARYLTDSDRHDGWTITRQMQFIELLARGFGIAASARALGMSSAGVYALRKRSPNFGVMWDMALDEGRLRNYDVAIARGMDGYTTPVYRRGKLVGVRHRHDNRMLFAACYGESMRRYPGEPKPGRS